MALERVEVDERDGPRLGERRHRHHQRLPPGTPLSTIRAPNAGWHPAKYTCGERSRWNGSRSL